VFKSWGYLGSHALELLEKSSCVLWDWLLTRTIDSTDLHTMHFTPVGDQLDANDDLHGGLSTAIAVLKS